MSHYVFSPSLHLLCQVDNMRDLVKNRSRVLAPLLDGFNEKQN